MAKKPKIQQAEILGTYDEPEPVRRKLAAAYRKRAQDDPELTEAERTEFARMADAWLKTLPEEK